MARAKPQIGSGNVAVKGPANLEQRFQPMDDVAVLPQNVNVYNTVLVYTLLSPSSMCIQSSKALRFPAGRGNKVGRL